MTMAYAPLSAGRRPQRGHNTHTHKPTIRQSLGKPRRVRRTAFPGILTSIGWCLSLGVVSAGLLQILTVFLVGSGLLFTGQSSILAPGDYFGTGGLPILIVGGTDGSGTRAFVDTLRRLGVPILFDDPSTFDIHARELFDQQGWPSLIDLVISHTHSANYEWDDLPPDAQQILQQEIPKLLRGLKGKLRRASLLEKKMFHHHRKITPKARGVAFAIKAPVAMLVLPVLTKFVGKIKFLHVLRDGRDIALSNNQSPVLKFYNTTYSDHDQRLQKYQGDLWNVRGIQLWNDWNYQVHMFAQNHSHLVDYFMMRSEDLLLKRQECFQGLADFVRATMSIQDICCASSAETMVDYGKSSIHTEKHHNFYGSQHGKREPEAGESHLNKDLQAPQTNEQERRRVAWRQAYSMHNLQQGKKELKALDSYLKERQTDLEKINAALQAREISLLRLVASLQENEERHNDRAHENDVGDTNFKRRFLLQEDSNETQQQQQQLSSAAAHFMSNFGQWKERIKTEGDTFDSETLQQMLQIGNSMVNAYQENQAEVRDILALHEILNSIGKLKFLLRQRKPHVNPELFLRGYDTFKTSVEHDYQKLQLASVYRLIEFGNDLAEQWSFIDDDQKKTHPGLKDFNVQNILTLVSSLERLARELELDGGTNYALKERRDELRKKVLYTAQNQAGVNAQHYMGFLGEKGRENVKHRYGKWQRLLANNTKLSEHLHREGAKALEIFGYEPQRKFFYYETPESGSICNENVMC